MLHIHIFLATPLYTGNITEPCANQYENEIAIGEGSYYAGTATNLPVEAFDDVVGADASPVLIGESRVCQRFLSQSSTFFATSGNFISRRAVTTSHAFAWAAALLS